MSWSCGIVGLPNAGKSSLFKAITALDVGIESYPFSTIDPNRAIVGLPDGRLPQLAETVKAAKVTCASIEVIDIAGLVKGASRGEGLGNRFLGQLRNCDLLIHVIADYDSSTGSSNVLAEKAAVINTELCLADIETVQKRLQKNEGKLKSGDAKALFEQQLLLRLEAELNHENPARSIEFTREENEVVRELFLLTAKKMVCVINVSERQLQEQPDGLFLDGCPAIRLCARLEAELAELPPDDKEEFMNLYDLHDSMVSELLSACYSLLGLITFYTVKGTESRAWVIAGKTSAVGAAAKIHTDMHDGFINVEVISWQDLVKASSLQDAKDKGLLRVEGRDYKVLDGDVLQFRYRA